MSSNVARATCSRGSDSLAINIAARHFDCAHSSPEQNKRGLSTQPCRTRVRGSLHDNERHLHAKTGRHTTHHFFLLRTSYPHTIYMGDQCISRLSAVSERAELG